MLLNYFENINSEHFNGLSSDHSLVCVLSVIILLLSHEGLSDVVVHLLPLSVR